MERIEIHIDKKPNWMMGGKISFFYRNKNTGKIYVGQPIVFKELAEGEIAPATLELTNEEMDFLLKRMQEQLKLNGLEMQLEVAGELKATKVHLENMRTLVFDKEKGK